MKQEVSAPILIGALAAALVLVSILGWLFLRPASSGASGELTGQQLKAYQTRKQHDEAD